MKFNFLVPLVLSTISAGAVNLPLRIPFQGKLIDPASNNPRNGDIVMTFRVYDAPTGGAAMFTEAMTVPVNNGVFAVQIGTSALLSSDLFSHASAYLGVTVAGDSEMLPRQPLTMGAYAFTSMQLVSHEAIRVNSGTAYSTFTTAGNWIMPYGVTGGTATFMTVASTNVGTFSIVSSSGISMLRGTLELDAASRGIRATGTGITASTGMFTAYLESGAAAAPAVSAAGTLRHYYDSPRAQWLASASGRAFSPVGTMSITFWNTNAVAGVANQGLNLPAALTEFNSAIQGTRMQLDCDNLPAQLALRYNLRSITGTALTIDLSVRDTANTANVLATVSQLATGANTTFAGQGALAAKPGWCTGTQTVAVYTSGGNGAADYILPHLILVGEP